MPLKKYEEKRDFARTPEPAPKRPAAQEGPPVFVVQKHAARRLHYDLRLEAGGALKSWAITAGPSLDPQVKRLAVMVEDHPLDYASFEGEIPKGEYGGGQVIVWDAGDYSPDDEGVLSFDDRAAAEKRVSEGLEQGKLSFTLRGRKLKGSWTLVKMKRGENDWLLIKHRDAAADASMDILAEDASVLSGATIEDMKGGRGRPPQAGVTGLSELPEARRAPFPRKILPMLASLARAPFSGPDWSFEPKLDGYRVLAAIEGGKVRLLSRRGLDNTAKYGPVAAGLASQPVAQAWLDGEIVALDGQGKICFECLQGYLESVGRKEKLPTDATAIIYFVFDILYLDGYELLKAPLERRQELLARVLRPAATVRLTEHFEGNGEVIYKAMVAEGLEGVIAKRRGTSYEPGQRSRDWLKVKAVQTEDFVVGGYTAGTGNRARTFGSLVMGYFDDDKKLMPAGNVGTGFDEKLLADFKKRLDALKTDKSPFAVPPEPGPPVTWVRPEMVIEVKYAEKTRDGRLRAPVFLRLREDKPAVEVEAMPDPESPAPSPKKPGKPAAQVEAAADPPESPSASPRRKPGRKQDDGDLAGVLEQLNDKREEFTVEVEGSRIKLTHLGKDLWPAAGKQPPVTKRDFLVYLATVSPHLLNHLRDRPLTLSRYPDGVGGEQFYQKHWSSAVPDFVATVRLSEQRQKNQEYLLCNNLPTLLWLGQVADLELHTWFSRVSPGPDRAVPDSVTPAEAGDYMSHYPDFMIFDIDPYVYAGTEKKGEEPALNREGFAAAGRAAGWVRELLDGFGWSSFIKTSGKTGLHIYVPLLRQYDFGAVHSAAKTICQFILQRHPKDVTIEWSVEKRPGKVFLDYNQNVRGKNLISIYSPRASPGASVSVPLRWDELGAIYPTDFTVFNVPERLARLGDLWADILEKKNDLKKLLETIKG
jgi:bifunctional non-homologous end joining protein LigD